MDATQAGEAGELTERLRAGLPHDAVVTDPDITAEYVLGLDVVLADGRLMHTGRRTAKGVAGYDLTRLFVGSEGSLGIVVRAVLALKPAPPPQLALAAEFPSTTTACDAVCAIMEAGHVPSLLELMDRTTVRAVNDMAHMGLPD